MRPLNVLRIKYSHTANTHTHHFHCGTVLKLDSSSVSELAHHRAFNTYTVNYTVNEVILPQSSLFLLFCSRVAFLGMIESMVRYDI